MSYYDDIAIPKAVDTSFDDSVTLSYRQKYSTDQYWKQWDIKKGGQLPSLGIVYRSSITLQVPVIDLQLFEQSQISQNAILFLHC